MLKILVDMNLSPQWEAALAQHGWECRHWSSIGDYQAADQTIMEWAETNGYIVFTHDLDFGTLLAATQAQGPSVIQVRTQDVLPSHLETIVVEVLRQYEGALRLGALITVDESTSRVRLLPLIR
jgi:predicted nuclease of predicted toxin-antitoxin system